MRWLGWHRLMTRREAWAIYGSTDGPMHRGIASLPSEVVAYLDGSNPYIKDGQLPSNPSEAKKVKVRAIRFIVMNDELYKKGFPLPYLKCLNPKEATYVLWEIHESICENHSRPRFLVGNHSNIRPT